ncbi:SDR family NAD(P)-dependent oxidoreductase [Actinokineospora diospyrosa]|uniref:NAD(P)-dependent dehydrogenase, short-chain alcohol dehydrogenase family n=1 Tax=Actinokineospora diospyrosa TaxID=103728 RepID=A0ABT1I8Y9_9PSEU|nr:SDR family oxidoreductase [Actinokineospora diospyrosa]MCP2269093.1 NAD(P)-dependent dehydrogenase, short-chain alcohol dehydrogenase family [Actinokineospora diospyrosa]
MSDRFAGKVALVTGGAGGIGGAVATALAGQGAKVAVADLDLDAATALAESIGGLPVALDVGDADSVAAAVASTTDELGPIDVLVHTAGIVGGGGPLNGLPVEVFDAVTRVNFRGTFLITQAVANAMIAAGTRGAMVHISSAGAFSPTPGLGHYEATKAGMNALIRSAALELAEHGIRVNAVAPGPVDTPMTNFSAAPPEALAFWTERIPLGRIATPADLVPQVLLFASEDTRHITGTVLAVDGGQLLKG